MVREVEYVGGERAGETTREEAFALTSLLPQQADPARLLALWRGHWQIENGLHYVRDVTRGEDACQVRSGSAPAVFAACRNTTLNLLRRAGHANIAAALRRSAMYPREALALLGIPEHEKTLTVPHCTPHMRLAHGILLVMCACGVPRITFLAPSQQHRIIGPALP